MKVSQPLVMFRLPLTYIKIVVGAALGAAYGYALTIFPSSDPDFGWHLRVGEWIVRNHAVPRVDTYSFTLPGHSWVDHEWLLNAGWWWMYAHGLWGIVAVIFTLLAIVPLLIWIRRSQSRADLWLVTLLGAFLFQFTASMRPHVVSFFLFFLVAEVLADRARGNDKRKLYAVLALPILFLLWANLHAAFIAGLALMAIWIVARALEHRRDSGRFRYPGIGADGAILAASAVATLITPYGLDLYREILRVSLSPIMMQYINEWHPAFAVPQLLLPLGALLGVLGFLLQRTWNRIALPHRLLGLVFLALSLKTAKLGPQFAVLAAPLLLQGREILHHDVVQSNGAIEHLTPRLRTTTWVAGWGLWLVLFLYLAFALASVGPPEHPDAALAALRATAQREGTLHVFQPYAWGGWLLWAAPEVRVFIDGRMPSWRDAEGRYILRDYVAVGTMPGAWREIFARRNVDTALLAKKHPPVAGYSPGALLARMLHGDQRKRLAEHPIMRWIAHRAASPPSVPLAAELRHDGWHTIYEGDDALVLRCPRKPCY